MSLRNAMRKAAGLLIELPADEMPPYSSSSDGGNEFELPSEARLPLDSPSGAHRPIPKTIDELVREANGPSLDEVKVDETQLSGTSSAIAGDKIDFAAIYRAANLPQSSFGAEQMLETLSSLPSELPLETRRSTVKAMMATLGKATGATPESVVTDASRKLAALHSFAQFMERKTADVTAKAEAEITELEAQIDAKRQSIQAAKNELAKVTRGCETESDKLDDVLEFFSLDLGPSKYAPQETQPPNHPTT